MKIYTRNFDIKSYLDSRSISFKIAGPDISPGWIGMKCLFCDDNLTHLGINLRGKYYSCWRCGENDSISYLVKLIEDCNWNKVQTIIEQFKESGESIAEDYFTDTESKPINKVLLPEDCSRTFPKSYMNYLRERNFNPKRLIKQYDLRACSNIGQYKFRMIIPFFVDGKIVTFTAMDMTGKANVPYKHCPIDKSVLSIKNILYNIDAAGVNIVMVEGVTDVWRIGPGTVGTMGANVTKEQVIFLMSRGVKKVLVLSDSDASEKWKILAKQLSLFSMGMIEVFHGELSFGDPDTMNQKTLSKARRFLRS